MTAPKTQANRSPTSRPLYDITLSDEALRALLAYFRATNHVGLDPAAVRAYSEETRQALLQAGERALWARGILRYSPERREIRVWNRAARLVKTGIQPQQVFFFERQHADRSVERVWAYRDATRWVLHTYPYIGVHQIMEIPGPRHFLQVVGTTMELLQYTNAPQVPAMTLPAAVLQRLWQLVRQDEEGAAAQHLLAQQEVPSTTRAAFFDSLQNFVAYYRFARWSSSDKTEGAQLAALAGADVLWGFFTQRDHIMVQPLTGEAFLQQLRAFYEV